MESGSLMVTVKNENGSLVYFDNNGVSITAAEARALISATPEGAASVNEKALKDKAVTALAANQAFLDLASPTNAQVVAQVRSLTRQMNALIRLTVRQLDSTNGT
jgi:hypothetical protein